MSLAKCVSLLLVAGLYGCYDDPSVTKLQFMPDMNDAPIAKAQREFLDPPENSVSHQAVLYLATAEEAEKQFINPFKGSKEEAKHRDNGQHLFNTFCIVCHGPDAKGGGTIIDKFPRPPDITTASYQLKEDGWFFHRITFGTALMPSYGHAISVSERWEIVSYLRTLQKAPQ